MRVDGFEKDVEEGEQGKQQPERAGPKIKVGKGGQGKRRKKSEDHKERPDPAEHLVRKEAKGYRIEFSEQVRKSGEVLEVARCDAYFSSEFLAKLVGNILVNDGPRFVHAFASFFKRFHVDVKIIHQEIARHFAERIFSQSIASPEGSHHGAPYFSFRIFDEYLGPDVGFLLYGNAAFVQSAIDHIGIHQRDRGVFKMFYQPVNGILIEHHVGIGDNEDAVRGHFCERVDDHHLARALGESHKLKSREFFFEFIYDRVRAVGGIIRADEHLHFFCRIIAVENAFDLFSDHRLFVVRSHQDAYSRQFLFGKNGLVRFCANGKHAKEQGIK